MQPLYTREIGNPADPKREGARDGAPGVGKRTLAEALEPAPGRPADHAAGRAPDAEARVAAQGVAGAAQPLPHVDRIQALFGRHQVTGVRAQVGGAAAGAAGAMGASAYAM